MAILYQCGSIQKPDAEQQKWIIDYKIQNWQNHMTLYKDIHMDGKTYTDLIQNLEPCSTLMGWEEI